MDPHAELVSQLFSAAKRASNFRELKTYYFHNCIYGKVYETDSFRDGVSLHDLTRHCTREWKLVLVGDAAMHPAELLGGGGWYGSSEEGERMAGVRWMQMLADHFDRSAWLNPDSPDVLEGRHRGDARRTLPDVPPDARGPRRGHGPSVEGARAQALTRPRHAAACYEPGARPSFPRAVCPLSRPLSPESPWKSREGSRPMSGDLRAEIARRRTFAIISHPDAGKTTLTEKLLLYGGVIQLAGAVKAKRGRASAVSDWMEMERERGISITTSVLQFPYRGLQMNLLDTPGHADFSEDTYRTLHAVDGAVMLLDCAKGVEPQTKKLFRVCRQRKMPIFTFVNKMDRPGRDPFDLVGEVESVLGIGVVSRSPGPSSAAAPSVGVYERTTRRVHIFDPSRAGSSAAVGAEVHGEPGPRSRRPCGRARRSARRRTRSSARRPTLLDAAGDRFDRARFESGEVSPMFFGSAINNFGLEAFLDTFCELMPPPERATARAPDRSIRTTGGFSGFVFKIQANMDRAHRDRVAFLRICSGRFERGMKVRHVRTGREMRLANPTQFLAQERTIVEEAFAGDVIGIYDPGIFEIGDTLTDGADLTFEEIPSFAPEHFARARARPIRCAASSS